MESSVGRYDNECAFDSTKRKIRRKKKVQEKEANI